VNCHWSAGQFVGERNRLFIIQRLVSNAVILTVNNVHVKFIPFRGGGGGGLTRRVIGPLQTLYMVMQPPCPWSLCVGLESNLE